MSTIASYDIRIMTAFPNAQTRDHGYLAYLEDEKKYLGGLFWNLDKSKKLRYHPIDNVRTRDSVKEAIAVYGSEACLFHYSGHASMKALQMEEDVFTAESFAWYIKSCPMLRLVFLNGCSTRGFIREIFERLADQEGPMPAIIATSAPVMDDAASRFAMEFYRFFVERDFSVREAFSAALSDYTGTYISKEENVFRMELTDRKLTGVNIIPEKGKTRASKSKYDEMVGSPDIPATWALYVRQEESLNWKLFEKQGDPSTRLDKLKERLLTEKDILGAMDKEIAVIAENVGAMMPGAIKEKNEKGLQELKDKRETSVAAIADLLRQKKEAMEEIQDEKTIRVFGSQFHQLNYGKQQKYFESMHDDFGQVTGFVLHGTTECGIKVLSRRVVEFLKLQETWTVLFDAGSPVQKPIWQKIADDLRLDVPDYNPEAVVAAIQGLHRYDEETTQNGFLFVFYNPAEDPAYRQFTETALRFWKQFTDIFLKLDSGSGWQHRINLFIIDGNCERKGKGKYSSDREAVYDQMIKATGNSGNLVRILPVVYPLTAAEITAWQVRIPQFLEPMLLKPAEKVQVIRETEGKLLPAIKEIGRLKVKNPYKKNLAYSEFEKDFLTPSFTARI
jgi:hypothetical protein